MNRDDICQGWKLRYFSILIGQGLSLVGTAVTQFVLMWWIADTTGSVSSLATAGLFGVLPQALISPFAGTFADRYSRRFIMIAADAISAICIAILIPLFVSNRIELWHIYTMMFLRSSMQAFQQPAMNATTPLLVPYSFIPRASGLNQIVNGITQIAAPIIGAMAIAAMPLGYALSIDIITSIFGIASLLIFAIPQGMREQVGEFRTEFVEGFNYVWSNSGLRTMFCLLSINLLIVMPVFPLTPLLVRDHFQGGPPQVALFQAFGAIGFILGGLVVVIFKPMRKFMWFINGFALACFSLLIIGLLPSNRLLAASVMFCLGTTTVMAANAAITALLQMTVPNDIQGRVFSLRIAVDALMAPIGLIFIAPLGDKIGVNHLVALLGATACLTQLSGYLFGSLRSLDTRPIISSVGS